MQVWEGLQREIAVCSCYHGDNSSLETQFCSCVDIKCPKPNPNRAKKVAWRKVNHCSSSSQQPVCKKCAGPHRLIKCLDVRCCVERCGALGVLGAGSCEDGVGGGRGRDRLLLLLDLHVLVLLCFPLSSGPGANFFASFSALLCRCRRISMLSWAVGGRATA